MFFFFGIVAKDAQARPEGVAEAGAAQHDGHEDLEALVEDRPGERDLHADLALVHGPVRERLERTMVSAFDAVFERHERRGVSMRSAAYVRALERIGEAIESQGTHEFFAGR